MNDQPAPRQAASVFPDETWGPATILTVGLTLVVAIVGGLVVLFGDGLSFQEYVTVLGLTTIGSGLLGVGRGIMSRTM